MTDTIIRVEDLGKKYQLGRNAIQDGARYRTLRDTLTDGARSIFRNPKSASRDSSTEEFWALRDVGFGVSQGEVVGIIGRNGAGKSTLLKILSRITEPTTGKIGIKGRVASLLEVGTGFHPELTGRENIFLNGAILGMGRAEIKAKFDEIVAFADVERFLETPVKRYSSGMYVRLAFAVAAHLEPEILIVDEVLAVGDAEFQKKCLGKMQQVAKGGRTVLFVSHSMPAVTRLCSRCLLLDAGRLVQDGPASEVAAFYLRSGQGLSTERRWPDDTTAPSSSVARLRAARVLTSEGPASAEAVQVGDSVGVQIEFDVLEDGAVLVPNFHFFNYEGTCLFVTHDWQNGARNRPRRRGIYRSTVWMPPHFFNEGAVIVGVALSTYIPFVVHFYERDAVAFQVSDDPAAPTRGDYTGAIPGAVRPLLKWTDSFEPAAASLPHV